VTWTEYWLALPMYLVKGRFYLEADLDPEVTDTNCGALYLLAPIKFRIPSPFDKSGMPRYILCSSRQLREELCVSITINIMPFTAAVLLALICIEETAIGIFVLVK